MVLGMKQNLRYREDPKVSLWIFGGGDGREDRGVTGCPFGSRRNTPGPSPQVKEIPYSGHAVEKEEKPAKKNVFGVESISPLHFGVCFFLFSVMGLGVRIPETTSSPWALTKYSP